VINDPRLVARVARGVMLAVAVLVSPGCSQRGDAAEPRGGAVVPGAEPAAKPMPAALRGTDWTCTWIAVDGRAITPDASDAPTLRIDPPANATGRGGVNRFGGPAELAAGEPGATGTIGFPAIAATKMAGPPERMALEGAYFTALRAARRYEIKGDELTLHGDAAAVATFKAAPKAD
jgi:heat shock protein HslJ